MSEGNTETITISDHSKKKNSKLISIIIAVILIIAAGIGIYLYQQEKEKKAAEEHGKMLEQYEKNLNTFLLGAYTAGSTAETIIGTYADVWHSAIWDNSVKIDGKKYYDFNDALVAQYTLFNRTGLLDTFDETFDLTIEAMEKLYDPPTEFKREFDAVEDVFDALNELVSLAKNPNGSLQTYSASGNEKSSQVASNLQKLDRLLK